MRCVYREARTSCEDEPGGPAQVGQPLTITMTATRNEASMYFVYWNIHNMTYLIDWYTHAWYALATPT